MLQRLGRARSAGGDTGTDPARAGAGDVGGPGGPGADAGQAAGPDGAGSLAGAGSATAVDAGAAGAASHGGTSEPTTAEGATATDQAGADQAAADQAGADQAAADQAAVDAADRRRPGGGGGPAAKADPVRSAALPEDFSLPQQDPLRAFLLSQTGAVDISRLELASPALAALKAAGVVLVVPLVSSGELIGLLNLGPRLSERGYSADDRRLLSALAGYAAPAMRVGQLVRQQQAEARDRERIEQELKVAQLIQQQFLPKSLPDLPSWHVAAFYRPARSVGGDFYDFIPLPDGRLMVVIGDVTDKGVPAALVMASTHALLRGAAPRLIAPGQVLAQVNDLLCTDIPAHMFVTCLALVLDPATGLLEFANAGHDVPYVRTEDGVAELRARGMPLGLMTGMEYEEKTFQLRPGDAVLLHSDGLAEAHSPDREMFGFPRVAALVGESEAGEALIDACLAALAAFTGPDHDQEDDITLVTIERRHSAVYAEGRS